MKFSERKGFRSISEVIQMKGMTEKLRNLLDEPNLSAADAKFFLLSCTSFINYLKAKL